MEYEIFELFDHNASNVIRLPFFNDIINYNNFLISHLIFKIESQGSPLTCIGMGRIRYLWTSAHIGRVVYNKHLIVREGTGGGL